MIGAQTQPIGRSPRAFVSSEDRAMPQRSSSPARSITAESTTSGGAHSHDYDRLMRQHVKLTQAFEVAFTSRSFLII
jgi:hypothetical protein